MALSCNAKSKRYAESDAALAAKFAEAGFGTAKDNALSLHPLEETFEADKFSLPVEQDLSLIGTKFRKWGLSGNTVPATRLPQITIEVLVGGGVPGSKRPFLERLCWVGNHLFPVDPDDPSKALAGRTGADGAVKGEEEGFGF